MPREHITLMRDPLAYVESFGKADRQHVKDALHAEGRDTVLRLCLSPYGAIPLRALGYIAAAQQIHTYMPHAQLQIIIPQHTIAAVNAISVERTREAANRLIAAHDSIPPLVEPVLEIGEKRVCSTIFAVDTPTHEDIDIALLARSLEATPVAEKLKAQAKVRGDLPYGDESYLHYLAGHVRMHDMADSVEAYFLEQRDDVMRAERIISIGSHASERAFYLGRMAYRNAASDTRLVPATGQIFTRHVLPPYQPRRQPREPHEQLFDPMLEDLHELNNPALEQMVGYRDVVVRDIQHLRMYMKSSLGAVAIGSSFSQLPA